MTKGMKEIARWALAVFALVPLAALAAACSGDGDNGAASDEADVDAHQDDELAITVRTEKVSYDPDVITVKVGQTVRLTLENADPLLHDFTSEDAAFVILESRGAVHAMHDDGDMHEEGEDAHADGDMHDESEDAHTDGDMHDDDMGAEKTVKLHIAADAESDALLVFHATEPGEYVVYCSVEGHREAGMEAKIIVEP